MPRIHWIALVFSALLALVSASAPSFCKCTCFKNSTIIPLNPTHDQTPSDGTHRFLQERDTSPYFSEAKKTLLARSGPASCSRCNRAYCLSSGLPICRNAEEKDVTAVCFQRDSRKDNIIVWGFLAATAGLLGWAAAKRVLAARATADNIATAAPLLGATSGSAGGQPGLFQRIAGVFGGDRNNRGGNAHAQAGARGNGLRMPFSPTAAEPRGQYAPLSGSGTD